MKAEKLKVKDINFAPYNPRIMSKEMMDDLKTSISRFGYVEPIVVNKQTMNVVGGNQRLQALIELGAEEVEAVIVDLPLEQEKVLNIALNEISGDWDYEKLKQVIDSISDEVLKELAGFTEIEMFDDLEGIEIEDIKEFRVNDDEEICPNCGYHFRLSENGKS